MNRLVRHARPRRGSHGPCRAASRPSRSPPPRRPGVGRHTTLTVRYPVNGSTFLKAANATVTLGPGTLRSKVNLTTGKVTASLNLPPATGSFKELGVVPVTATVAFIQDGPTTGTVNLNTGAVTTMSKITLQVTSLSVSGLPVPVGPACESATPASVALASQPGFSIVNGGHRQRHLYGPAVRSLRPGHAGAQPDRHRPGQHHLAHPRQGARSRLMSSYE